jgi:methyl-accepting chemotaxis protein
MRDAINDAIKTVTPSFIRRRYTVKFVVSILFVIVVITSVGMFGFVQAQQTVQEESEQQLNTTAETRAASIASLVQNKKIQTASISRTAEVTSNSESTVTGFISSRVRDSQRYSGPESGANIAGVHVVQTDGTVFASTDESLQGQSVDSVDRVWADNFAFATDINDAQVVRTFPTVGIVDGQRRLAFASPIAGTDRVVIVESPLGVTLESSNPTFTTAIVNQNGNLVTERDEQSAGFGDGVNASGIRAQFASGMVSEGFITRGERLYSIRPVQGTQQWVAVTSVSTTEAFAVSQSVGQTIGVIIITALLSLGLVGVVLGFQTVTPLTELRRKIQRMEEGDLSVELQTTREDEIGRLYGGFASMRDSLQNRIGEIEATNRRLEQKATEYSAVMRACAAGDLTQRMEPGEADDSMAEIAREFNEMVEELETTTEEIKRFADQVAISSREVTVSADEVLAASEQVSDTVQEINEGAERQNSSLQGINADVEELSDTIDDIAASSTEVASLAAETAETGQEGRQAAQEAIADMDEVTEESEVAVRQMERLEEETQQIDELIEFVDGIAQRTNMLALNANIEANREPEAGDRSGFGVIANEIKDLSEEAQQATENIAQRLERIQEQTGEAADVVEQTSRQITDSAANVREAVQALQEVAEYAEETNQGIQSISEANAEQAETTTEVATEVEEVAEISTRTSREAETVATLAAEQTGVVSQMSESAEDLSERAERLHDRLEGFETDADVAPEAAPTPDAGAGNSDDGESPDDPLAGFDAEADADAVDRSDGDGPDLTRTGSSPAEADGEEDDAEADSHSPPVPDGWGDD